ncbi:MAG: DUF1573 domain-containing protein [Prevotella sp.]|nr:DUF1573 domain-containing protein [Prevotella sp.]
MLLADTLVVLGLATVSLGTISEADGPVERTFRLRNAGTGSVALQQGYTSCGCTTISFAQGKTVAPGDTTSVTLRFNPRGKGGEFLETATLVYGPGRGERVRLSLEGTCQSSEESLLRQFPISLSDSLRLSASHFDLGVMSVGQTQERGIVVLHRSSQGDRQERVPVTFTVTPQTPKGLQHIERPLLIGGQRVVVTLDVMVK